MNDELVKSIEFILGSNAERSKRNEYDSILETSIAALFLVRSMPEIEGSKEIEKGILPSIYYAISKILPELSSSSPAIGRGDISEANVACSFCSRKPPQVRLGAGPNVFICNECVDTFGEIFHEPASSS